MKKPYIYFKFLGIHSFIDTLDNSGTEYKLFEDDLSSLFSRHEETLNSDDTVTIGILTREGQEVFFAEVGIKITKSFRSYFVFIFTHHPTLDDMESVVQGLEGLISENLDKIDPTEISRNLQNPSGGHTIN